MPVIGYETHNGKALPFHQTAAGRAKAKAEREAEKLEERRFNKVWHRKIHLPIENWHLMHSLADSPIIQHSRFAFGRQLEIEVPHKHDIIIIAARAVVEAYNQKSYHGIIDPISVEALTKAPTIRHACETEPVVFLLLRECTYIKLQLKLVRQADAPGMIAEVLVRDGVNTHSLRAWLETLPDHRMPNIAQLALETQYQHWMETKKPFRFTDLPDELQKQISVDAVGETVEPTFNLLSHLIGHPVALPYLGLKRTVTNKFYVNPLPEQPSTVNRALLEVNRSTRAITLEALLHNTTKRYTKLSSVYELAKFTPKPHLNFLVHIELAMSHLSYIGLFDCAIKPFTDFAFLGRRDIVNPRLVLALTTFPNLQHLTLFFMSTIESTYSPWVSYSVPDGADRTLRYPNIDFCRLPCQKVLVDQIMAFAAGYIVKMKNLKVVELTGCIKTETKTKYEDLLNEKNGEIDHTEEIEQMKREIAALPDYAFPPRCFCPKPCGSVALDQVRKQHRRPPSSRDTAGQARHFEKCLAKDFARTTNEYIFDAEDIPEEPFSDWTLPGVPDEGWSIMRDERLPKIEEWHSRRGPT
ncbi:hypothetical protein LTR17_016873 [Elasticomyces elasticus]|nr:hypothetical protein LTR17_016873 [Elasticomyces elasticus]